MTHVRDNEWFTNSKPQYQNKNIGDYTYGNPNLQWWTPECRIGKFCSIAGNVTIFGGGEHRPDWVTTYPFNSLSHIFGFGKDITGHPSSKGPTLIGNDVWIGFGATIISGVVVGDGAVIGAQAVVAKNVPPYAVVAGNPAKVSRFRFTPVQINELLNIKWWNFDLNVIAKYIYLLQSDNVDLFIKAINKDDVIYNE